MSLWFTDGLKPIQTHTTNKYTQTHKYFPIKYELPIKITFLTFFLQPNTDPKQKSNLRKKTPPVL